MCTVIGVFHKGLDACQTRESRGFVRPRDVGQLVGRRGEREQLAQGRCVFEALADALAGEGGEGVCGVAEQERGAAVVAPSR